MKKSTFLIVLILYSLSVLIVLYGLFFGLSHRWSWVILGGNLMIIPWLICLIHSTKNKNPVSVPWVYFLFFTGYIAMPFYLIKLVKENRIH